DERGRQRGLAMTVHLADEPPRELDGRDLGTEGAPEGALDEVSDLGLEGAEDAHRGRPFGLRAAIGQHPCYATVRERWFGSPAKASAAASATAATVSGECACPARWAITAVATSS